MHQFGNRGQDGHLPHDGAEPFAANEDAEVTLFILIDFDLVGIEAIATQEGEVPEW